MAKRKKRRNSESPEGSDIDNVGTSKKTIRTSNARNPSGKNQYPSVPSIEEMAELLHDYHKKNPNFKYPDYIAALMNDHSIRIGRSKLALYLKQLGLSTSSRGNHIPEAEKTQLILDELAKDPHQTRGPRAIREALNLAGHKIARDDISGVMHAFEEDGFEKRHPRSKKSLVRTPLTSVGPHEEWSMDGHDKLNKVGFGILGLRDKWGRKYLHYRVFPSNRYADTTGVFYLECAKKHGGIPTQVSSDRGSEVRDAYAFQTTLRQQFAPDLDPSLIPPWMFLDSTRNITVESGWRPLFYTWGVNVLEFFQSGLDDGFFEPGNYIHEQTSNWIWFPAVQRSLDQFCHEQNNHRIRRQHDKILPSGGTPNDFYANPAAYGGTDCLIPVDEAVLDQLLQEARDAAHEHMRYVDDGFNDFAQEAYAALGKPEITLQNAWTVFSSHGWSAWTT
ncbi:hypothetical protein MSAN_00564700 [Mycena sanguinolenta]|uniref:Integrase core domain-containing protein n=1 Tax=Mycena sanguinolenta TaxID=230812 RepID=A0A8H7DII4_9AGAR|nr:hypothetical protein MSAN_00564700 [Mycena sanguinolenta]